MKLEIDLTKKISEIQQYICIAYFGMTLNSSMVRYGTVGSSVNWMAWPLRLMASVLGTGVVTDALLRDLLDFLASDCNGVPTYFSLAWLLQDVCVVLLK